MATNPPKGDGHRNGAVRDRSQTYNPSNQRWTNGMRKPAVSWIRRRTANPSRASVRSAEMANGVARIAVA